MRMMLKMMMKMMKMMLVVMKMMMMTLFMVKMVVNMVIKGRRVILVFRFSYEYQMPSFLSYGLCTQGRMDIETAIEKMMVFLTKMKISTMSMMLTVVMLFYIACC